MKKLLTVAFALSLCYAQAQELPKPSPESTLKQQVGLTDITIVYSRPGVKGRQVFGGLVPYHEVWRTGANSNTTISFSSPVEIEGHTLPAGKYSLFTIPDQDKWVVIFNKKTDMWGAYTYQDSNDVARVEVMPANCDSTETFTIDINNIRDESANLVLRWATTQVKVPFHVKTTEIAIKNIGKAIAEAEPDKKWQAYSNAAAYYYNSHMDLNQALGYINKSIDMHDNRWYSHWLKAEILADQKNYTEAIKSARKAIDVGKADAKATGKDFDYETSINNSIDKWKKSN